MGIAGALALIFSALFAGAALYVSIAEHPARMKLDAAHAVAQWSPAYDRGYVMQASLAILAGVAGLAEWWKFSGVLWLIGGLLMLANWPWTLIAIMPVNRKLKAIAHGSASDDATSLLNRWARLHAVRTILSLAAVACFGLGGQILK